MKGFVLLSTTFFIAIISLIVLNLASSLNLDHKILNQLIFRETVFTELEDNAQEIISKVSSMQNLDCYVDPARELVNYEYVNKKGCQYANAWYLLKDLGDLACVVVNDAQNSFATHHYTLYLIGQDLKNNLLQIRFATVGKLSQCLQLPQRLIKPGILSWLLIS